MLGVDPGLSGALAVWDGKVLSVKDMPIYTKLIGKKQRNRIDALQLLNEIETAQLCGVEIAYVEDVMGRGNQRGASEMGYGVGLIHMACVALKLRYEIVLPGAWKGRMKAPADKKQSAIRAGQLFPEYASLFRGPRGGTLDGRAEAAMIAMWGATR